MAALLFCAAAVEAPGQEAGRLSSIQRGTNGEVTLRIEAPGQQNYRLDAATNLAQGGSLPDWQPLLSFPGGTTNTQVDAGAAFLGRRFYRTEEIATNAITGDIIATEAGAAIVRPVNHASFVISWNGLMIYNDPVEGAAPYRSFARADIILVSHTHGDHFNADTLRAVRATNGVILAPRAMTNGLILALRTNTITLTNGESVTVRGVTVEAVPAYNGNHTRGTGNGYVMTLGGKRFYMSGDTGDVAEMRALQNIDAAFLCMNIPFTMNVASAASAARDFKPRILYPYHYRNQDGTFADLNQLKRLIGPEAGIEVRVRKWY